MAVERLIQKIKLGERELMQDSMCKLISMISENKKTQEEIIKALPENNIITMMAYLEDPDPYFRKLTAKFFLDLLYGNFVVQQIFCDILGILPFDGKVCINRIPDSFKRANRSIAECLEIMKKGCSEEIKDNLPYCWYFNPENANNTGKQVEFLFENQKNGLEDLDRFVDPLSVMLGFIVQIPKAKKHYEKTVEYAGKSILSKELEAKKVVTALNRKPFHLVNNSLDQSLQGQLLNDSKSVERETLKNLSPMRGLVSNGITSSRVNQSRNSKPKVELLTSPSICNSERANQSKFGLTSDRGGEGSKNIDKEIHKIFGTKRFCIENDKMKTLNITEIKDKKPQNRRPDCSIDTVDLMQTSKVTASNNDSQDLGSKLENSSIISAMNKSSLPSKHNEKNLDVSLYKVANDRKSELIKKNISRYDQSKTNMRTSKNTRDINSHSFSMATTPKNNLLSKILKDKSISKEVISATKQTYQKQEISKRLNMTNTVMVSSPTKHITQKLSIALHQLKAPSKSELYYTNKKHGFHASLLKSIDRNDQTSTTILIEEKEESAVKENLNQDSSERRQSLKTNTRSKISQLVSVLKGSVTTPRTPTEILKSTLNQNSKILNARRSQDSSYLTSLARDKRKSDAPIPFQNLKNRYSDMKDNSIVRNSLTEFTLDFTQSTTPKTYIK